MKLYLLFPFLLCSVLYAQESTLIDSLNPNPLKDEMIQSDSLNDNDYYDDEFEEISDETYNPISELRGLSISFAKSIFFDSNLFNNPDKVHLNPGFSFSLMLNTGNKLFRTDLDLRITSQDFRLSSISGSKEYSLAFISAGLRLKYQIPFERVQPYLLGSFYYSYGEMDFSEMKYTAILRGYSFGFGPGTSFKIFNNVFLSVEGIMEFGWGYWDEDPLINSTGSGINFNNLRIQFVLGF